MFETSSTVVMEEMSWPEIEAAIGGGRKTALFACGAVEQHGPHLPTGVDTYLGTAVAERVAGMLDDVLVAPTLRPGCSDHHTGFPGTLTLRFETFVMLLEDYCTSLSRHGFDLIVMFSSHGGNTDLMAAHFPAIARKLRGQARVFMVVPLLDAMEKQAQLVGEHGISRGAAGVHAGYLETSEMLAVRPDLVNMENASPGRSDEGFYSPERVRISQLESFTYGVKGQAPNGILGDPAGADAKVGERLLDLKAEMIAAQIRQLRA